MIQRNTKPVITPNKKNLLLGIPLAFFLFSVLFNIMATASVSTVGGEIHALDMKRIALKKQNDAYEIQIATSQSLQFVKEEAVTLGYIPIQSIVAVDTAMSSQSLQAKR
ncbi:hypothetical protein KBD71_03675 [Candidatus Woesebacteria bacterium]|nr:hypothetical protein [Candidatus Woesebacteria bacterium]